ncbi:MAG: hypothetical protein KKB34_05470 [Bacteroidetes bacterium]|nr:hypothetical protein [Bacteroidota bacterium]
MYTKKFFLPLIIAFSFLSLGWGYVGHRIINGNSVLSFSKGIEFINSWSGYLADHASDADRRKSQQPEESPKHYIDIDAYTEFLTTGKINQNYDSLLSKYGKNFVEAQGSLPWAILDAVDSLQKLFERNDWDKAKLIASDLGHYVGDAHMPLHLTKNYNGQYSGTYGVHSRYESTLIGKYSGQIKYDGDSLLYIKDRSDYIFNFIYANYIYVDSVNRADEYALSIAGSYNEVYYTELWNLTGKFTVNLFEDASNVLANLIYTAWIDSGSPVITDMKDNVQTPGKFFLKQNYPNPFNPTTTIEYTIPSTAMSTSDSRSNNFSAEKIDVQNKVQLAIYDILGREITLLVNEQQSSGTYKVVFNGSNLSSGVYLYALKVGNYIETKKLLLLE